MLSRAATVLRPDMVASVTVLGSPFRGIRSHPLVLEMSERVRARIQLRDRVDGREERPLCYTGYCSCGAVSAFLEAIPDSIPSVAIYTKTDGVVDWRFCVNDDPATNFEVTGTHVGLAFNPQVFSLLATQLAASRL